MKRLLAAATVGLIVLAMATSGTAAQQTSTRLERRIAWQEQHIRQLQHRRAYLHRYIRHLRNPAPVQTSPPALPASGSGSTSTSTTSTASGGWADELRAVGFPESAIPHMLYIIQRESGGNPNAINASSGACGLTQLYPCYGGSAWLDPMANLRMAFQKYQASGFAPWGG